MIKLILGAVLTIGLTPLTTNAQTFERNYGGYRISHPRSGMDLNIPGGPTNYRGVTLYPRIKGDIEQSFYLRRQDSDDFSQKIPHHQILFSKYNNKSPGQPHCLNLTYGEAYNAVSSYTCIHDTGGLQNWRLAPVGHGNYFMLQSTNRRNNDLCIEPTRSRNFVPNTPINMQQCNFRDPNQWWYLEKF